MQTESPKPQSLAYREGTPEDRAFLHLFVEALYIAARLDHFRDLPDVTQLSQERDQKAFFHRRKNAAWDFGVNDTTMGFWWNAARNFMANKYDGANQKPERGEDWHIPHETGPIGDQTFGAILSFATPPHMVAHWYDEKRLTGKRPPKATVDDMLNFIRDQFTRGTPPVAMTQQEEQLVRDFCASHPALFSDKPRERTRPRKADEDVTPGQWSETLKDNAPPMAKRLIGTRRGTLRAREEPSEKPGLFR